AGGGRAGPGVPAPLEPSRPPGRPARRRAPAPAGDPSDDRVHRADRRLSAAAMHRVAVVGAGLMGTGTAQVFAEAGLAVTLYARRRESLATARQRIVENQAAMREAGLPV